MARDPYDTSANTNAFERAGRRFVERARAAVPHESAGLIVNDRGRARVVPIDNVSRDPCNAFQLAPDQVARVFCACEVAGLIHSHTGADITPSPIDEAMAAALHAPSVIVSAQTGAVGVTYPPALLNAPAALCGRAWVYGVADCYTALRDAYQLWGGIVLPDFVRVPMGDGWRQIADHFSDCALVPVESSTYEPLDVVLYDFGDALPLNHCGVITPDGLLFHHVAGRLSCREPFIAHWRSAVALHLRHVSMMGDAS